MRRTVLWLGLTLFLASCAPTVVQPQPETGVLPVRLELAFHSELPDLYYVLSGPAYTYGRFRVNEDFAGYLRQQLRAVSASGESPEARIAVELLSLTTDFNEIGAGPPAVHPGRLAMATDPSRIRALQAVADIESDGDFNLPETTIKQAAMTFRVKLSRGERVLAEETLQASFSERYDWYFDHPAMQNWARYDYGSVLQGLYRQAWQQLREFVVRNLP